MTYAQKIIAHLCVQALKAGYDQPWISRSDLLNGKLAPKRAPAGVGLKLMWAALTMPDGFLEWSQDEQSFRLSEGALMALVNEVDDLKQERA